MQPAHIEQRYYSFMPLLKEELYVVATKGEVNEVAGYLIHGITRELPIKHPPKLRIEDCWIDLADLVKIWLEAHPDPEDGGPGETLADGVGLRRITVLIELEQSAHAETVADEQLPRLVNKVIELADSQGADFNYNSDKDSPYFGFVEIIA